MLGVGLLWTIKCYSRKISARLTAFIISSRILAAVVSAFYVDDFIFAFSDVSHNAPHATVFFLMLPSTVLFFSSCSSPSLDVTQTSGSLSRLFSPLPTTAHSSFCFCEEIPAVSSLLDSHRVTPAHTDKYTFKQYLVS